TGWSTPSRKRTSCPKTGSSSSPSSHPALPAVPTGCTCVGTNVAGRHLDSPGSPNPSRGRDPGRVETRLTEFWRELILAKSGIRQMEGGISALAVFIGFQERVGVTGPPRAFTGVISDSGNGNVDPGDGLRVGGARDDAGSR